MILKSQTIFLLKIKGLMCKSVVKIILGFCVFISLINNSGKDSLQGKVV